MKRIIVDLDNTITNDSSSINYKDKTYDSELVERLNQYRALGYEIIIFTARNMKTYKGDISKINLNTLPLIIDWLSKINLNYDGILVGKPWCGEDGFYIDDKAIRPSEFKALSSDESFKKTHSFKNEIYVSFFINHLLSSNFKSFSKLIDSDRIILCGKPEEYEMSLLQNFKNA